MFQSIGDGFDYNKRKALEYTKLNSFFQSDHPVNLPGRLILTFHSTFYTIEIILIPAVPLLLCATALLPRKHWVGNILSTILIVDHLQ